MKLRKKIVYVVNNLTTGGVTQIIKSTSITLCKYYDISIVSLSSKDSVWSNSHPVKVKYFDSNIIFEYSLINYFQDIVFGKVFRNNYKEVINFIISKNPDYLHFHTLPRFLKIGLLVKKKYDCQLVFTDHLVRISPKEYTLLIRTFLGIIYKQVYKHFNLIFVSKAVENVSRNFGFINSKYKNIRIDNGIDLSTFQKKIKKENQKIICIYVSRISLVKGHHELVKAWSKLKLPDKQELWIVGPDEMNNTIQDLCEDLGINNVKILGNRPDIKELLLKSDLGVFPSEKEGLPLSLLEKMASSIPVVVSNIDELTNIIEDNKDGLIYTLGNENDLTKKLQRLINNQELRLRLGRQARIKVEKRYSIDTVVNSLINFYTSL